MQTCTQCGLEEVDILEDACDGDEQNALVFESRAEVEVVVGNRSFEVVGS